MLSTSTADGEALNAIRAANAILEKENLTWEQFLGQSDSSSGSSRRRRSSSSPPPPPPPDEPLDWDAEIDGLLRRVPEKYHDFLASVQASFRQFGGLTPRQEAAVRKFMR